MLTAVIVAVIITIVILDSFSKSNLGISRQGSSCFAEGNSQKGSA